MITLNDIDLTKNEQRFIINLILYFRDIYDVDEGQLDDSCIGEYLKKSMRDNYAVILSISQKMIDACKQKRPA